MKLGDISDIRDVTHWWLLVTVLAKYVFNFTSRKMGYCHTLKWVLAFKSLNLLKSNLLFKNSNCTVVSDIWQISKTTTIQQRNSYFNNNNKKQTNKKNKHVANLFSSGMKNFRSNLKINQSYSKLSKLFFFFFRVCTENCLGAWVISSLAARHVAVSNHKSTVGNIHLLCKGVFG